MADKILFTSESVSPGHSDKVADIISDAIVDAYLSKDKNSRVACETMIAGNKVILGGEINSSITLSDDEIKKIVINTIRQIGYSEDYPFPKEDSLKLPYIDVEINLRPQSPEIAEGVDKWKRALAKSEPYNESSGYKKPVYANEEMYDPFYYLRKSEEEYRISVGIEKGGGAIGAGDQGIMFGYAEDNEDTEYLPVSIYLARSLAKYFYELDRKDKRYRIFGIDIKTQVTVVQDSQTGEVTGIDAIVVSIPTLFKEINKPAIEKIIVESGIFNKYDLKKAKIFINPAGSYIKHSPLYDCGLTGRKLIVDSYGGAARIGGGAQSGKDYTKVDRSAMYMARWIAKHIVKAGLAKRAEVQLSYAIGVSQPISFTLYTFGTESVDRKRIEEFILDNIDMSPEGIIKKFHLDDPKKVKYIETAKFGQVGNPKFPWEIFDDEFLEKLEQLREYKTELKSLDDLEREYPDVYAELMAGVTFHQSPEYTKKRMKEIEKSKKR
ncbi:methionine adenosyltransferase domain-containing protein [Nitrosophilus kaiyonis]|uniref:methionine adenosyltransferase domain-containing protein n=1 Tax=Nitrosophilus kaiyonis TaxID=2930200 RepID=UPI00249232E7|nr:methionine adenosyltransferase domain-containing protein [Nitrosophilus kaiyonis]